MGCDQYGRGTMYRNRYVSDPNPDLEWLCKKGWLHDHGAYQEFGGMHYYSVTAPGVAAMKSASPLPPKLSRDQRRYQAFLAADSGMTFKEWLQCKRYQRV
jgi:hypothetical protein